MSVEYSVVIFDKTFRLSKSQIEYDSPNFFTSYFIDSADEHNSRLLELSRDPYLFTIIMRYLNGYQVLPLHPALIPPHCTLKTTLTDLCADARFYQLNGLSSLLSSHQELKVEDQLIVRYAEVTGCYNTTSDMLEPIESLDKIAADYSLEFSNEEKYQNASNEDGFFTVPKNTKGGDPNVFFSGLLNERIIRGVLQREEYAALASRWELLGWKRDYPSQNCRRSFIFIKIWTRRESTAAGNNITS